MGTTLVKGPAAIKISGKCEILGASFEDTSIIYKSNKILPIETTNKTTISLINEDPLDENNRFSICTRQNVLGTRIWENIKDQIIKSNYKKILILGPTDSGKSTLTLFLANKFVNQGQYPLIIEGDVGQGDIAPSSCIGSLILNKNCIDLDEIQENHINFIGGIQPTGYEKRITRSIVSSYYRLNKKADLVIINMDGYIYGSGLKYKIDLIAKIKPDCIIYLGGDIEDNEYSKKMLKIIHSIKKELKARFSLINAKRSPTFIYKTQSERREKRIKGYFKFIDKKATINFMQLNKVKKIYFKGHFYRLDKKNITSPMRNYEYPLNDIPNYVINKDFLLNRFIGLSKNTDYEKILGFGIIKSFDKTGFLIKSVLKEFDCIFLSEIKLLIAE